MRLRDLTDADAEGAVIGHPEQDPEAAELEREEHDAGEDQARQERDHQLINHLHA